MIEHYGEYCVVHLGVDGSEVKVRTGTKTSVEVGQKIWLTADADSFYLFNSSDGRTLWPVKE